MELTIFKDIVLNVILIIFPILLYLLLSIYKENVSSNYNDLLINVALVTSLYLCLRFGLVETDNKILLFCNIPIVIAYTKKKYLFAIFLSLANIAYLYSTSETIAVICSLKYTSYFILYLCAEKKNLSSDSYILSAAVLQAFFLSFEYFFFKNNSSINDILILLVLVFIYYFTAFLILYFFRIIDKVQNLNITIKNLEKDKKTKDALFKLTHEIKNPLAVCKGYLEMINLDKREKAERYLDIMKDEINRSLNIMTDFLQFNKVKVNKKKICLETLIDDVCNSLLIVAKTNKVKIIHKGNREPLFIDGDYERLKQVLINLIKNSIEAIKIGNGIITIREYKIENYITLNIEDNGIGMDKDTLNHLKEMFYTTKENGTGLGVALSNEIIEAHNGSLDYDSTINKGTKVTIRLPIR